MSNYIASSASLWSTTLRRIIRDRVTFMALLVVVLYTLTALLASWGMLARTWDQEVGPSYAPPSTQYWFGTDLFGRSIVTKIIKGTEVAMSVGLVSGCIAVVIGLTLGALAGYFGGWVDDVIVWFYTVVASIPSTMLLIALSFVLGKGLLSIYVALGMTSWVELCRLIRGEVKRHKHQEYVLAATALGASHLRKLYYHILPNVLHVVIISFSLIFQYAIKSEVVLSYLGLGIQDGPSWGVMIYDARVELIRGVWWQLVFVTMAMFFIVLAFNILSDALRDALDPKLSGRG